ncbi:glyoxalase [Pseudomaricurvus alkylphenolicus]|uniref:VOC family protein n=1 Tax=Pseudomaricurvus alkylphenolicus TaxID=1306991 RepID=UPI001421BA3B|nr:VOC family protein [Pseudomaricurvus alkylphenolicus]NIB42472.1 glyoxalase [Pseudomaricurvus alkylphenolicus]
MKINPFHVAVPVRDITEARRFYGEILGCSEGRSDTHWVDFNMYGHQFVCHQDTSLAPDAENQKIYNPVDGHGVPVPHCGVVLDMQDWEILANRLKQHHIEFVIEPYVRFKGQQGEQATMFFCDPSGNALEFKAFRSMDQLFAVE